MAKSKFSDNQEQPLEPKQQSCQAHGCPLAGTKTLSPGDHKWWCRYHYGQDTSHFGTITDRIERAIPMIAHLQRVKRARADHITAEMPYLFHYERNPDFSKREGENAGQYAMRLEVTLKHFILDGCDKPKLNDAKSIVESSVEGLTEQLTRGAA